MNALLWKDQLVKTVELRADEFLDELSRAKHKISPKSVHDLRVAARRSLAVIQMTEVCLTKNSQGKLKRKIKKVMKLMSNLRDVHIQKEYIAEMLVVFHQLTPYYKILRLSEKALIKKAERKLSKYRMANFRKLFDEYNHLLEESFAAQETIIYKQAEVTRRVDDSFSVLVKRKREMMMSDLASVHRFRIALKNFRYQMENMVRLHSVDPTVLEEMHTFQTKLGNIQDLRIISSGLAHYGKGNEKIKIALQSILSEFSRKINNLVAEQVDNAGSIYAYWDYTDAMTSPSDQR